MPAPRDLMQYVNDLADPARIPAAAPDDPDTMATAHVIVCACVRRHTGTA